MTRSHVGQDSGVVKLAAGTRYLREQLGLQGLKFPPSEACIKDFVLNATEAVVQTLRPGESYIVCLCRHLDARARFIVLWTSSVEAYDRAVWSELVAIGRKHALPRAQSGAVELADA